jgi:hypothetical protein
MVPSTTSVDHKCMSARSTDLPRRQQGGRRRPAWPLEDHDLPRRAAPRRRERALCVRRRGLNRARFLAYVEQALLPTLPAGDLVMMDDLAAHKVAGVREAIAAAGAQVPAPTVPISARSSRSSPGSKACSAALQPAPSRRSGASSVDWSTPSLPKNAPTTSPAPAMFRPSGNALAAPDEALIAAGASSPRHYRTRRR